MADRDSWRESALLAADNQSQLFEQIKQLPSYERVASYLKQREAFSLASQTAELKKVKYQRLINTLEMIVLARNLPRVADPAIVERYQALIDLEETHLDLQ